MFTYDAHAFAATQAAELALHFILAKPKGAGAILHLAAILQQPLTLDRVIHRHAKREIRRILMRIGDSIETP